jgi:hypothetical protein
MSKQKRTKSTTQLQEVKPFDAIKENKPPMRRYPSFESFWNSCVKNSKKIHFDSCKAHMQSLGTLDNPDRWIEGVRSFGINIEE